MPRHSHTTQDFGPRLRRLRQERGWTQEQLAQLAGVTKRAINYYETDGKYPPAPAVLKLANTLGATVEILMGHEEPKPSTRASDGPNLLEDADDRRLWRKFRQIKLLSDRDQASVFRVLTALVETSQRS